MGRAFAKNAALTPAGVNNFSNLHARRSDDHASSW
jgi:hypothetical protein